MKHLTDDQFSDCLTAAVPDPAIQAHLAQCDECRVELGVFLAAMDDFSAAALEWSRTQPGTSMKAARPSAGMAMPLRWALAAILIAAAGVPVALYRERSAGAPVSVDAGDSAAQIAQDNRLLESVDTALAQSDPSPIEIYRLDTPAHGSRTQARVE